MLTAAPSLEPGVPRVGYAISRAVGTAVARNRLRRRLRQAAGVVAPRLDPNRAYLIAAAKGAIDLTYREIEAAVAHLATELGREAA